MNNDELMAREAIRHTLASYHIAGDGNDADGYSAVFPEDGVVRASGMEISGRELLRRPARNRSRRHRRLSHSSQGWTFQEEGHYRPEAVDAPSQA